MYGMHRSSIYEAVAKGRVSAGLDAKGQRVIDLSEAIRVWGELPAKPTAKPDTRQAAALAEQTYQTAALQPLIEELRLLREEVAGLRAELRLLEHRPVEAVKPAPDEKKLERTEGAAKNFADLLKALPE